MSISVATLSVLPPEWSEDLLHSIQEQVRISDRKIVVLDDDPTGTQTVVCLCTPRGPWKTSRLSSRVLFRPFTFSPTLAVSPNLRPSNSAVRSEATSSRLLKIPGWKSR